MSAPRETADADQYQAAAKEVAAADLASWLMPDGKAETLTETEDDAKVGPAAAAFARWLARPKVAGCELASASPRPLFGLTTDTKGYVYCAACFEQLLAVMFHKDRPEWHCTLCAQPSDQLRPALSTHGVLTGAAFSCSDCYDAERRAVVSSRFSRIAGQARGRH